MNDALIEQEGLSPERKSVLPGPGFFVLDSIKREQFVVEVADSLAGASVIVVADPDADGLACAALIREMYGEVALVETSPHDIERGLKFVAEYGESNASVFICDLSPDAIDSITEPLTRVASRSERVRWFDHHEWDSVTAEAVRSMGVDLVVGESDEECSADVTFRELEFEFPDRLVEFVEVTRDHDLWLREDPRSDDLADYAYWADSEEYLDVVSRHGADLPADVQSLLQEKRVDKEDRIERAVRRIEYHEIEDISVGVTYGRCSQNEVGEAIRRGGGDAAVIIKPTGSISLRGTDSFQRCHEVARRLGGGGHPKAAGCKPDIYSDMLEYAYHWTTQGAVAKRVTLAAFERVIGKN